MMSTYTSRDAADKLDKSINTESKSCDQAQQDKAPIRFRRLQLNNFILIVNKTLVNIAKRNIIRTSNQNMKIIEPHHDKTSLIPYATNKD